MKNCVRCEAPAFQVQIKVGDEESKFVLLCEQCLEELRGRVTDFLPDENKEKAQ